MIRRSIHVAAAPILGDVAVQAMPRRCAVPHSAAPAAPRDSFNAMACECSLKKLNQQQESQPQNSTSTSVDFAARCPISLTGAQMSDRQHGTASISALENCPWLSCQEASGLTSLPSVHGEPVRSPPQCAPTTATTAPIQTAVPAAAAFKIFKGQTPPLRKAKMVQTVSPHAQAATTTSASVLKDGASLAPMQHGGPVATWEGEGKASTRGATIGRPRADTRSMRSTFSGFASYDGAAPSVEQAMLSGCEIGNFGLTMNAASTAPRLGRQPLVPSDAARDKMVSPLRASVVDTGDSDLSSRCSPPSDQRSSGVKSGANDVAPREVAESDRSTIFVGRHHDDSTVGPHGRRTARDTQQHLENQSDRETSVMFACPSIEYCFEKDTIGAICTRESAVLCAQDSVMRRSSASPMAKDSNVFGRVFRATLSQQRRFMATPSSEPEWTCPKTNHDEGVDEEAHPHRRETVARAHNRRRRVASPAPRIVALSNTSTIAENGSVDTTQATTAITDGANGTTNDVDGTNRALNTNTNTDTNSNKNGAGFNSGLSEEIVRRLIAEGKHREAVAQMSQDQLAALLDKYSATAAALGVAPPSRSGELEKSEVKSETAPKNGAVKMNGFHASTSTPMKANGYHGAEHPTTEDQVKDPTTKAEGDDVKPVDADAKANSVEPSEHVAVAENCEKQSRAPIPPQSANQWSLLFIRTALPFFAFGVCDNIIMIAAGDLIDEHFGVVMGFSTLVAAGFGQAVSDGSGVTLQCMIERWTEKFHIADHHIDPKYLESTWGNRIQQLFRTIGIVIGCLVGLLPAVLTDVGNKPRLYDLLLGALPQEERKRLSQKGKFKHFKPGDFIVKRGENCTHLHTIITGEAEIVGVTPTGEEVVICTPGPGEGIGFLELVFEHPSVASVRCATPMKTLSISKADFDTCLRDKEAFRQSVEDFIRDDPSYALYRISRPTKPDHDHDASATA